METSPLPTYYNTEPPHWYAQVWLTQSCIRRMYKDTFLNYTVVKCYVTKIIQNVKSKFLLFFKQFLVSLYKKLRFY